VLGGPGARASWWHGSSRQVAPCGRLAARGRRRAAARRARARARLAGPGASGSVRGRRSAGGAVPRRWLGARQADGVARQGSAREQAGRAAHGVAGGARTRPRR
jgi:hypothetical protein